MISCEMKYKVAVERMLQVDMILTGSNFSCREDEKIDFEDSLGMYGFASYSLILNSIFSFYAKHNNYCGLY